MDRRLRAAIQYCKAHDSEILVRTTREKILMIKKNPSAENIVISWEEIEEFGKILAGEKRLKYCCTSDNFLDRRSV